MCYVTCYCLNKEEATPRPPPPPPPPPLINEILAVCRVIGDAHTVVSEYELGVYADGRSYACSYVGKECTLMWRVSNVVSVTGFCGLCV